MTLIEYTVFFFFLYKSRLFSVVSMTSYIFMVAFGFSLGSLPSLSGARLIGVNVSVNYCLSLAVLALRPAGDLSRVYTASLQH